MQVHVTFTNGRHGRFCLYENTAGYRYVYHQVGSAFVRTHVRPGARNEWVEWTP